MFRWCKMIEINKKEKQLIISYNWRYIVAIISVFLMSIIILIYQYGGITHMAEFTVCSSTQASHGRLDHKYPSPRCCIHHDCLQYDLGRYAILTTLRTDDYFPYLKKLSCSIKQSNPDVKLIVATVKGDLSDEIEEAVILLGDHVEFVYWKDYVIPNHLKSRYSYNWVKIRAWEMIQYDAILMVDSDTVILEDINHLFKLPTHFATVLDEDKDIPKYSSLGSMQGGVILFRPCAQVAKHMIKLLDNHRELRFINQHAEQNFFDWYFRYERYILPTRYNSIKHLLSEDNLSRDGSRPIIVHNTRKEHDHFENFEIGTLQDIGSCDDFPEGYL